MINRCPCRKCLIAPVCKDPCDDFSKFAEPLTKLIDWLEKFFEYVDTILDETIFSKPYNWIGENLIVPVSFFLFITIFSVKTDKHNITLFDQRLTIWDENRVKE